MSDQPNVKRWTAKRKTVVVMDIMKGKTTAAEVARQHDLTVSEVERWIDEAQKTWKTALSPGPVTSESSMSRNCGIPRRRWGSPPADPCAKKFKRLLDEDENS